MSCVCTCLQYQAAACKKVEDEKLRQKLCAARVRQTEVLMVLLHTFCSGAALLLPCIVIHLTQVRAGRHCNQQQGGAGQGWARL